MASQKRLNIILCSVIALLVSFAIYLGIIVFVVNPYLESNEKLPNIFNFYDERKPDSLPNVYVLGNSQVREDVNATTIQDLLREKNIRYNVYNLGYTGDTPLRRLTELQSIRKSHPKIVVLGVSYISFNDRGNVPYEQLLISADKITLDNTSRSLFTPAELHWISTNFFEKSYEKRIWILPAVRGSILSNNHENLLSHNFKDPFIYSINQTDDELQEKIRDRADEQQAYVSFSGTDNRQKAAFLHTVRVLHDSGTKVVLVLMPLNPLLEKTVNETDRQGIREFLRTVDAPLIDLESGFDRSDFIDFVHMNSAGRDKFSRLLAGKLFQE